MTKQCCIILIMKPYAPQISILILSISLLIPLFFYGQKSINPKDLTYTDTIPIKPGSQQHERSQQFYDSIYKKFSRHKVTKLMYSLAFNGNSQNYLPDSLQKMASETPFKKYKGKIIRSIAIIPLSPFGTNLNDTSERAKTGSGKLLNALHIDTRKYVIRKNLLFKPGDPVDPQVFSDNERLLRDLPSIDVASILLSPCGINRDSVDVTVITKDVWSIGFILNILTISNTNFSIYDANFLGLADRLTFSFSGDIYRAPFSRVDGVSYLLSNIGGSFIDGYVMLKQDDDRNKKMEAGVQRTFISNKTKWAGGAWVNYIEDVAYQANYTKFISYYSSDNLWLGWAFGLKPRKEPTRLVLTGSAYNRNYSSRPYVSIDSNRSYYNNFQFFSGIAISRNNYYLINYVLDFGKIENIPYGYLFQITTGRDQNDFYSRIYAGCILSAGNFIQKFGYLSGSLAMGGFFHGYSYEDGVIKARLLYMTNLFKSPGLYKFRIYLVTNYKLGFNYRSNNPDLTGPNTLPDFNDFKTENSLRGDQLLSSTFSSMMFTPWYFYGFKFSVFGQIQAGFVSRKNVPIDFSHSFYSGFRLGLLIKNDNLITPAYMISAFFYPNTREGMPWFMYSVTYAPNFYIPDFNVTAPRSETLQN
jgi:hypothetical protein